jgi:hypothetical protein
MNVYQYVSINFEDLLDIIEKFNSFSIKLLNDYGGFIEE